MLKKFTYLSIPLLLFGSSAAFSAGFPSEPGSTPGSGTSASPISDSDAQDERLYAFDDHVTVVPNKISTVEGDVTTNDKNGSFTELTSSPVSEYGYLVFNSDGSFTYTLYENAASVTDLKVGDVITDTFSYMYIADSGQSAVAKLNVQIIANPVDANGDTVFQAPVDEPYDNVDVEFNDRSAQATPLNSGRNIKGHLHHSADKDWYKIASSGNEIISLEVCPKGSSCFGKKSWVLYVFDSAKLTKEMEENRFIFSRWVDETGSTQDEMGNQIISGTNGSSNHMYLNYRVGTFDGALIGIIDPCFDTSNTVDLAVGNGARNYLVAVSSVLKGDSGDAENCGGGSVVLEEAGFNVVGQAPDGEDEDGRAKVKDKKYTTTQQYISVFPKSDDQYSIKVTGTGLHPLLSEEAKVKSATFNVNTGELTLPKVRIFDQLYSANLAMQETAASPARGVKTISNLSFGLSNLSSLNAEEDNDAFQATYNPSNQQVIIPRVTDSASDKAYSVIMEYHPATDKLNQWLELISYELIK